MDILPDILNAATGDLFLLYRGNGGLCCTPWCDSWGCRFFGYGVIGLIVVVSVPVPIPISVPISVSVPVTAVLLLRVDSISYHTKQVCFNGSQAICSTQDHTSAIFLRLHDQHDSVDEPTNHRGIAGGKYGRAVNQDLIVIGFSPTD